MDDTPLFRKPERLTGDDAPCVHLCYCERAKLLADVVRLQEAKRMAGLVADERSRENVALRDIITRARNALVRGGDVTATAELLMGALEQGGTTDGT